MCSTTNVYRKKKEFDVIYAFNGNNGENGNLQWIETIEYEIYIIVKDLNKVRLVDDKYLFI